MGAIRHEVKRAIYSIFKEKGRFPNLQEMCDALSFSSDNTRKCMAALAETGYIENIGEWYRYPEETDMVRIASEGAIEEIEVKTPVIINMNDLKDTKLVTDEEQEEVKITLSKIDDANKKIEDMIDSGSFKILDLPNTTPGKIKELKYKPSLLEKASLLYKTSTGMLKASLKATRKENKEFEKVLPEEKKRPGRPLGKRKSQIESFIDSQEKKNGLRENITLYGVPIYVIQVCMGVIGVGASIISIYYTSIWLIEFLPIAFALLLSSIMVGFSVSAFETVILFLSGQVTKSRWTKIFIASGFAVLWIIVSCFSVLSTIAGQYNRHVADIREQARTGVESGKASWSILQERKADLIRRMSEHRQQTGVLNNLLSGMGDIKSRTDNTQLWNETQYRLTEANKEIMKTSEELDKIRTEEEKQIRESKKSGTVLSSTGSANIPDFYGWLAGIFKAQRDWIQFIMSLFPAVFVDVISPVGVALSLFLRNKYKKA